MCRALRLPNCFSPVYGLLLYTIGGVKFPMENIRKIILDELKAVLSGFPGNR
jgi:hypothetical protein